MRRQKKIKQLDIVFENCEVFSLTPDMIDICWFDGLQNNIGINCFQYEDGEVYDYISCEEFVLVINESGMNKTGGFDFETTLKERLNYCDIKHIDIIYHKDNTYITVPWEDKNGNEYCNALQHNINTNKYGKKTLAVVISHQKMSKQKIIEKYGFDY